MNNSTTTNILLLDIGNTCIKAANLNKKNNKISKCFTISNNDSFTKFIAKSKIKNFSKVVYITSANELLTNRFISGIKAQYPNVELIKVTKDTFVKDIDLSNINKKVVIGTDILLCAYYLIKNYNSNAFLCLGTVYFCVITKGNKILSVQLMPNITTGLHTISSSTSIPESLIPKKYDKEVGLNTPDAFASGAKLMMEGYIDLIANKYGLNPKDIIISGGETDKYMILSKKYHFIKYGSLEALAQLVQDKNL